MSNTMDTEQNSHHSDSHVHFPEEQLREHDAQILTKHLDDSSIAVHLGFLQINHDYRIHFTVNDGLSDPVPVVDPLSSVNARIIEVLPGETTGTHQITVDFFASREKLMKEALSMKSTDGSKSVSVLLHARVLGKGKGTPSLRIGIRCIGERSELDSETSSDWQGFEDV